MNNMQFVGSTTARARVQLLSGVAARTLIAATSALVLSSAAEAQPATTVPPTTTVQNPPADVQTNSTLPDQVIPATQANNTTSSPSDQNIVVTGSRIRRPNLESVIPVTSIQGEQFFQKGGTTIGDQLNDLPQLRSTFAQQNSGLGVGTAGLNLLDLRGLAPSAPWCSSTAAVTLLPTS